MSSNQIESIILASYRKVTSSWAGGKTTVKIVETETIGSAGEGQKAWSKNGKWSGQNASLRVNVMPNWMEAIDARGLSEVDGLLTTHVSESQTIDGFEVVKAGWVRQGKGFSLYSESGWIAHTPGDEWAFHSISSAKAAISGLKKKIKAAGVPQAEKDAAKHARANARAARRQQQIEKLVTKIARLDLGELADVVVTRDDSIRAGNCVPGTDEFIERFGAGETSAKLSDLAQRMVAKIGSIPEWSASNLTLARQVVATILIAVRRQRRRLA